MTTPIQTHELPDGRTIAYAAYGPPDGPLLVHHHGVPGSRLELEVVADVLEGSDVRVVVPDRPGIGGSGPDPQTGLSAFARDTLALADALGAAGFSTSGLSAGGPYALACAAVAPDRVGAVLLLSSAGDPSTPDPGEGVVRSERFLDTLALDHPGAARGLWRMMEPVMRHAPAAVTGSLRRQPRDSELLATDEARRRVAEAMALSMEQGTRAMIDDWARCYRPWDFDPAAVRAPVHLWHGEQDGLVPIRMARHLHAELPGSVLTELPDTGHIGTLSVFGDVLAAVAR